MMKLIYQVLLQIILIAFNAFFAATEIAVISLNEKKVKARAEEGDKKAKIMLKMLESPTQFLSTIQIGITLAGFLGSAFAAENFADQMSSVIVETFQIPIEQMEIMNTISVISITFILSFFTLIFGELVPKRIAMKYKEDLAEKVCGFITILATILKPFISLLTITTNAVLRMFHIDPNENFESVSKEDIVLMLDAGRDEGSLDEHNITYIKNVFKLDDMCAKDVMTPKKSVTCILSNATQEEILNIIKQEEYSRIPVVDFNMNRIIGILHTREYLLNYKLPNFHFIDFVHSTAFVPESMHLDTLFTTMQKNHNHMVVVVNEYGETSGIVTMEDILEELVGEIWDECDEIIENFTKLESGDYRVLCSACIDEFFEYFNLTVDSWIEASTVNGWIIGQLGKIPKESESFVYKNLVIKIVKADSYMVHEVIVKKMKSNAE